MKRILALVVLAVLGFAIAGCGSGKKAGTHRAARVARPHVLKRVVGPHGIDVLGVGTATFANVRPGTTVRCKGSPTLTVPYDQRQAAAVRGPVARAIKVTRSLNGTVTVSCSS